MANDHLSPDKQLDPGPLVGTLSIVCNGNIKNQPKARKNSPILRPVNIGNIKADGRFAEMQTEKFGQ